MQQWEKAYKKWFMANHDSKIQNSLDKHSEMSNFEIMQRLQGTREEIQKDNEMKELFKAMYQRQEEKGTITIDTKQVQQTAAGIIDELQQAIEKEL